MLNYLDLFLVLMLAWGAWRGYRLGFVNLVTGWISYLVAALLAALYTRPLAEALDQAWHLSSRWSGWLAPILPLPAPVLSQPAGGEAARQMEVFLGQLPLPGIIRQNLLEWVLKSPANTLGQALAGQLAFLALELITLVVLFYGSLLLLRQLARWSARGLRASPLGLVSRWLGLALGLLGQAFWLSILVGLTRSLLATPAITGVPGFLPLARQLYGSGVALRLGNFYDWLAELLHTLI